MTSTETVNTAYRLHLEYVDETGRLLRDQRLTVAEFGHAIRSTSFDAVCCGLADSYQSLPESARIEPSFPDGATSPQAKGFRVTIPLPDGRDHHRDFDLSYFGSAANRYQAQLLRTQAMTGEQRLHYRLTAFLNDEESAQPATRLNISFDPPDNIALAAGRRGDFGAATPFDQPNQADLPVLVDQHVLDEAVSEARENPEHEIAGFLLGRLCRDELSQEVFVAVTGLASARNTTEATETSVTYTPASFAQVRDIIALRGNGESVIGWYHSHPFKLCAECPLPTPPECIAKVLFYSQDDIHLMETTFEQPFMVGLLTAVEPRIEEAIGHLPVRLYGWRNGRINERGFEVVSATAR
jgi:proteasome lid subunit RPN8/RPN11